MIIGIKDWSTTFSLNDSSTPPLNLKSETNEYPFIIKVQPNDSTIKIMNIRPKYIPNMLLISGKYDVKIEKPGYRDQRLWVDHPHDTVIEIKLVKLDQ